jgi:hypothetical protein
VKEVVVDNTNIYTLVKKTEKQSSSRAPITAIRRRKRPTGRAPRNCPAHDTVTPRAVSPSRETRLAAAPACPPARPLASFASIPLVPATQTLLILSPSAVASQPSHVRLAALAPARSLAPRPLDKYRGCKRPRSSFSSPPLAFPSRSPGGKAAGERAARRSGSPRLTFYSCYALLRRRLAPSPGGSGEFLCGSSSWP